MASAIVNDLSPASPALAALLADRGINALGRELVRSVRVGNPNRAVAGRAANSTGRYPSRKMGRTIQYESRTVEFAFVILCETDSGVCEYYDQPCFLSLRYTSKRGRPVVVSHTPDFLVLSAEFAGFVECKPEDALPKLATEAPSRYVSEGQGIWRCPPGEAAAEPYGLGYRVWTPAGVSAALIDNARFLEAEWGRSPRMFSTTDLERVVERVRAKPGALLEELVHEVGDPDLVHWCIFRRHVHVDLAANFLSHPDRVRVFVDASAAAAWSAAVTTVADTHVSAPSVLARAVLTNYPPEALSVALERYRIIRPVVEAGLPPRSFTGPRCHTYRRWLRAYRKAEREGGVGFVGLCPKVHLRGNFAPRFPPETYTVLHNVANEVYESARNATAKSAYAIAVDRCGQLGLPCLSYTSFLEFLKKRNPDRALARRQGARAAAAAAPSFGPRDPAVQGQGPMDIVHLDHTLLDVLVRVGPEPDAATERLWLTVAICAWSRCVVGYDLSFDAPAVAGLFTALRDVLDRQGRMPNRIVVDRGAEVGSVAFDELCAACSIDKLQRPPGRPKFGSTVERLFGTVNKQLVHSLRGNTQLLKEPRQMSREVAPERDAVWRLSALDEAARRFLFEVYPRQPHAGLDGMTPRARFEQGLATVGAGRSLPDTADIRFLLWPPSPRGTSTVDPRTGIVVDRIHYWHADMRSVALRRKRVSVRVDPHDLAHVVAFLNGRWVLCRAECAADLAGRSRQELRLASMELRRRRRAGAKHQAIRVRELAAMLRELAETEEGLRRALRGEERRAVLKTRGLHLVDGLDSPTKDPAGSGETGWSTVDLNDLGSGTRL